MYACVSVMHYIRPVVVTHATWVDPDVQMEVRRQQAKQELLEGLEGKKADMRAIGEEVGQKRRWGLFFW